MPLMGFPSDKPVDSDSANQQNNVAQEIALYKQQFAELDNKVSAIRAKKKIADLSPETKVKLRPLYSKMHFLADRIASKLPEGTPEVKFYAERSSQCQQCAVACGSFIKSEIPSTTFADVKGLNEVKKVVKSFMFIAKHPEITKHYRREGGLGILMYGAPGTGKTLFAQALAHELNKPLFVITPSDIYKSHVGESEEMVKEIFDEIENCPDGSVLFVDEAESIFSKRGEDTQDYKAGVTTELLQRINGFNTDGSERYLIAATNRPEIIDPAYLRFKRFSYLIHITPPDEEAIESIVKSKTKGLISDDGMVKEIVELIIEQQKAARGARHSAADICGICEEACRKAIENIYYKYHADGEDEMSEEKRKELNLPPEPAVITDFESVSLDYFREALKTHGPSISAKDMEFYDNFKKGA